MTITSWTISSIAAALFGFSKAGIAGTGMLAIPLMASLFGAKASSGIVLPLLIAGDCMAIALYRRSVNWRLLGRILPAAAVGIVLGFFIMAHIDDQLLKRALGIIILALTALSPFLRTRSITTGKRSIIAALITGILAGAISMLANAAGPVMSLYLLWMNVDKKTFIGTTAWFFFVVNLCKVPFSASLNLITASTLLFNLKLIPALLVGIVAGLLFVAKINQTWFERIITVLVVLGGVNLILR